MPQYFDCFPKSVRSAAILTNSYVAGNVIDNANSYNTMQLFVDFTVGSLTDCQIKIEFSIDGTDYYQHSYDSIAAGVNSITPSVIKLTATGKPVYTLPINANYIKISAIGTGTVTTSSLKITAVLGIV